MHMSGVSPSTVREANRTVNALESEGIEVSGIVFDEEEDGFSVELGSGGRVRPQIIGGGTVKDVDPDE